MADKESDVTVSIRETVGYGVDARHVWLVLRQRARFIVGVGALLFAMVMGYTLMSGMQFQAISRLYLGELESKKQTANSDDFLGAGQGDVYSEVEIVRSRTRVKQAVLESGLNAGISESDAPAPRYWRWLMARRNPDYLDQTLRVVKVTHAVPVSRAQVPLALKVQFGENGSYRAYSDSGERLGSGVLGKPAQLTTVHLLLSAGSEGSPKPGTWYTIKVRPIEKAVDDALRDLVVTVAKVPTAVEPVKVLTLEFTDASPYKAADFLTHLMQVYLAERQSWKTEDAQAAEEFVTKQLENMEHQLGASEAKLADFRARNPMVVQQKQGENAAAQLGIYEEQRTAARLVVSSLKAIQQALTAPRPDIEQYMIQSRATPGSSARRKKTSRTKASAKRPDIQGANEGKSSSKTSVQPDIEHYMMGEAQDNVLQDMAASLAEAQRKLAESESHLYDDAPAVVQQRAVVENQLTMVRRYVASRLARAEEQVRSLDSVIAQARAKLQSVPDAELGLARIGRESEVYSRVYSYLLERQQQTQILRASTVSKNRIIDLPEIPVHEHSPKLMLRAASGLLGLLLGAIVAVLQSLATSSPRTEAELRDILGAVPFFASVPDYSRAQRRSKMRHVPVFDLLARPDLVGLAEAFRTLRANLYDAVPPDHGRVVLLNSPSSTDGKTTTTLCLAAILAADRKRVLVIDADLRKPSHHALLGCVQEPGLPELLDSRVSMSKAIQTVHISVGSFDVMTASVGAQAELLSRQRFAQLLINLRSSYDYILVDSASYPVVSDGLVLARLTDFVLSVIRLGSTPRKEMEQHVRELGRKARGFAVLVNGSSVSYQYGYGAEQPVGEWSQASAAEPGADPMLQ